MPKPVYYLLLLLIFGCSTKRERYESAQTVIDSAKQASIFQHLMDLTEIVPYEIQADSLAFLILPIHASCPFCRNRTIDDIVKNQNRVDERHFIIISSNVGRKAVSGFFRAQNYMLPEMSRLILDTTNDAKKYELYLDKPTIYYAFKKRVYRKVEAIPYTVRKDLSEFFQAGPKIKYKG